MSSSLDQSFATPIETLVLRWEEPPENLTKLMAYVNQRLHGIGFRFNGQERDQSNVLLTYSLQERRPVDSEIIHTVLGRFRESFKLTIISKE